MKLIFDPITDAALFYSGSDLSGAPRSESFDIEIDGVKLIILYSPDNKVVGIEVLGASRFVVPEVLGAAIPD